MLGRIPHVTLHFVLEGTGRVEIVGNANYDLEKGDMLVVPSHYSHVLRGQATQQELTETNIADDFPLKRLEAAGQGSGRFVVLCAAVSVSVQGVQFLEEFILNSLRAKKSEMPSITKLMELLIAELRDTDRLNQAILNALLLPCLLLAFRQKMINKDPSVSWLYAFGDAQLFKALKVMTMEPGATHTVESLAAVAGMSRARFAAQFSKRFGIAPVEMLRDLRLIRAAGLLAHAKDPVKRIASMVGFSSRSAFSRAFKAKWGVGPQHYRSANRVF